MAVSTTVQVTLPAMGESVTEGTVLEWHKHEGDHVEADETLVEISTDKVDAEVPAPVSGTVVKVHAAEGDTVTVGAVLVEIAPDGASGNGSGNGAAPAAPAPAADTAGEIVDIVTPGAGESVTEGTLLEWHAEVGDAVEDGDTIVEISTDKVDVELPAPADGVITELLAAEGDTVTVGQVIARMQLGAGAAATADAAAPAPRRGRRPGTRRARERARRHEASPRSPRASPPPRASTSPASPAPAPAAGSRRPTCSPPATARHPPRPPRHSRCAAARRCSPSTWTRAARSRPRPRSARSPSRRWTGAARQLKEAGQKVSFTHLIAWAIAQAATDDMPVMAHHFADAGRQARPARRRRRSTSASRWTSRRRTARGR